MIKSAKTAVCDQLKHVDITDAEPVLAFVRAEGLNRLPINEEIHMIWYL